MDALVRPVTRQRRPVSREPLPLDLAVWLWTSFVLVGAFSCGTYAHAWAWADSYDSVTAPDRCTDVLPDRHRERTVWVRVLWTLLSAGLFTAHVIWAVWLATRREDWWHRATIYMNDSSERQPLASAYHIYVIYQVVLLGVYLVLQLVLTVHRNVNDARYADYLLLHHLVWMPSVVVFLVIQWYTARNLYHRHRPTHKRSGKS